MWKMESKDYLEKDYKKKEATERDNSVRPKGDDKVALKPFVTLDAERKTKKKF
jgi:hypothetical protein